MTAYDDAASNASATCALDLGLLAICAEPFPKAAHAAAVLLTCLVGWQEYVIRHDLNVHDDECWVFMTDTDWEHYCGISRSQAHRFMAKFEELGWAVSTQQPRAAGRSKRSVTWYRLVPEAFPSSPRSRGVDRASRGAIHREAAADSAGAPSSSKRATPEGVHKARARAVTREQLAAWQPDEQLWAWTAKTNDRVGSGDLEQFRDHHLAAGTRMLDIAASWRTWVRNTLRWGAVGDKPAKRGVVKDDFESAAATWLAQQEADGQLSLGAGS